MSAGEAPLHVVVATDRGFIVPTAVTLRSVTASTPRAGRLTVLHDAVPLDLQQRVERSLVGDWALDWVDMSRRDSGRAPPHLSRAANFRLLIDPLLPTWGPRVLYLDVDVVVRHELEALFRRDLGDDAVAAVRSVNFPSIGSWGAVDHWPDLGLDPRAPYFNSGVILIDRDRWLDLDVGPRCLAHMASPRSRGELADQEALNVVLHRRWHQLEPRWNQQTPMLDHRRGAHAVFTPAQLEDALSDPAIVHFSDRPKPWSRDSTHPRTDEWRAVAGDTAFAPIRLDRRRRRDAAAWRIKRAAAALLRGR